MGQKKKREPLSVKSPGLLIHKFYAQATFSSVVVSSLVPTHTKVQSHGLLPIALNLLYHTEEEWPQNKQKIDHAVGWYHVEDLAYSKLLNLLC